MTAKGFRHKLAKVQNAAPQVGKVFESLLGFKPVSAFVCPVSFNRRMLLIGVANHEQLSLAKFQQSALELALKPVLLDKLHIETLKIVMRPQLDARQRLEQLRVSQADLAEPLSEHTLEQFETLGHLTKNPKLKRALEQICQKEQKLKGKKSPLGSLEE